MAAQVSRICTTVLHHSPRGPCRRHLSMHAKRFSSAASAPFTGFGLGRAAAARRLTSHRLPPAPAPQRLQLRCLASKSGGDKSWSDIAAEAGQLATDLAKKVGGAVSKAVSAIVPTEERAEARPQRRESERRQQDVFRPEDLGLGRGGGLVGGLLGRAVGSMLKSAVGALGEQIRQSQEQVADVQDRAARVIESNSKLRQRMGGAVQAGAPVSQSSMSSSINGRSRQTIQLIMPVVGSNGQTAQAQVQYTEGTDAAAEQLTVAVRLPNGQMLNLDGVSSAGVQTIDVEWRSVDDK